MGLTLFRDMFYILCTAKSVLSGSSFTKLRIDCFVTICVTIDILAIKSRFKMPLLLLLLNIEDFSKAFVTSGFLKIVLFL